jgi:hypothetical protein
LAAFAFIIVASWIAFGDSDDADLALALATVLTIVFFALPILVRRTAAARSRDKPQALDAFLGSHVETATGRLRGGEAWLQILTIPLALVLAAVMIGAAYLLVT